MNRLHGGSDNGGRCLHCDGHVSERFQSVFGDDDDRAHRCLGCDCFRRVSSGSAAGVNVDLPDPDDHPNRNRGQRVGAGVRADGGEFDGY